MISPDRETIKAKFKAAEDAIKLYERVSLTSLTSAVNELRYVGHHLLAIEGEKNEAIRSDLLVRADHHCQRAEYDAKEGVILALLDYLAGFRDGRFTSEELESVMPKWKGILQSARAAQKLLERAGCAKDFNGDEADRAIAALLDARDALMDAEVEINGMRQRKEEAKVAADRNAAERERAEQESRERLRRRTEDRRYVLNICLAVLGIVLSAASILLAVLTMRGQG